MIFDQTHSNIIQKELKIKKIKQGIKLEKRRLHKEYVQANRKKMIFMDLAMICVILFNLGALTITNLVVVQAEPDKTFVEANQVQCDWNGYACAQEDLGKKMMWGLIKQAMIWSVLIFLYLIRRFNVYTDEGYYLMLFFVVFYFWTTNLDFVHDLGLYLGKVFYGV